MSKNLLISADAVAKPPRGAEIAAHVPPDPPVLSNAVAYPPHGAGADGKYATNFAVFEEIEAIFAKIGALFDETRAQLKAIFANCAQNDAERAKLVATRAGSSATTFTGQLAVAGHSGISPEGGGVVVFGSGKNQKEPELNRATSPTVLKPNLEVEPQGFLNPKVVTILDDETQGSLVETQGSLESKMVTTLEVETQGSLVNTQGSLKPNMVTTLEVKTSGLDNSIIIQDDDDLSLTPKLVTMLESETKELGKLLSEKELDNLFLVPKLAAMKYTLVKNRIKLSHGDIGIKKDQNIITSEELMYDIFNTVWQNYKKRKKFVKSM